MHDEFLRQDLLEFLQKGPAHVSLIQALSDIKPANRFLRLNESLHSIWELLEHMRLAQEDILRYTIDENWISPKWPEGYWPPPNSPASEQKWENTLSGFYSDLNEVIALVKNKSLDLTAKIAHAQEHSYLREILLIIDHNAYHLGQILYLRKMLGDWK